MRLIYELFLLLLNSKMDLLTFSVRPRNSHIGMADPEHIDVNVVRMTIEYINFAIFPFFVLISFESMIYLYSIITCAAHEKMKCAISISISKLSRVTLKLLLYE